jgi:RNA polymerase sigma factor (sigma-70 family)
MNSTAQFGLTEQEAEAALQAVVELRLRARPGKPDETHAQLLTDGCVEDVLLAAAYRRGTPAALEAMQERFGNLVRFHVRRLLAPADAADAEAEVWSALWEKLRHYDGRSPLRAYLQILVKHWCYDRLRRRSAIGPEWGCSDPHDMLARTPAASTPTSDATACGAFSTDLDACTSEAMRSLPPPDRALLRLRFVHRMDLNELRQRPEIYTQGESALPIYGISRRVHRTARRLGQQIETLWRQRGYRLEDLKKLLVECEAVDMGSADAVFRAIAGEGAA